MSVLLRHKTRMRQKIIRIALIVLLLPYALATPYQIIHPPSTLMVYDTLRLDFPRRQWVPLRAISPSLIRAVVASEDGAFCSHWGFDFAQMQKSIERAERSDKPVRGTSTITQQLAKNLFLWQGRSWIRKALEFPLTFWLELTWSKGRILETYLNIVEWGDGIYGAEAAAHYYYGVPAARLSYAQAALLATTLPNPAKRSASHPGPAQAAMAGELMARLSHGAPDLSCIR